ncbi:hypothetical protein [Salininema proteolyticum]|uniref:Uncharacterized protein n=1 Tax=Salininema proteolyticum TaxID=1607685 RepID=A0ABV8TYZ4_9ACTN
MIDNFIELIARGSVRKRIYKGVVGLALALAAVGLLTDANAEAVISGLAVLGGGGGLLADANVTSDDT